MRLLPTLFAGLFWSIGAQAGEDGSWPWQSYRTTPLEPPSLEVTKSGDPTAPGYLFFAQDGLQAHNYSLFIMSEDNDLIWQSRYGAYSAFMPQHFRGEPVLVYHNGITFPEPYGFGYGIIEVLDNSYESIYNVTLTVDDGGYTTYDGFNESALHSWIDLHEARITAQDTMLVTLYNVTQYDLSAIGGPVDGWVTDSLFYEIDIATDEILFTWSALDHVDEIPLSDVTEFYPLDDYGRNKTVPYGYFHINSVDKFEDGSYIISSRFFCSIFKIARDGSVDWVLQGESGGDFDLDDEIFFTYQHDARIIKETHDGLDMSLYNNNIWGEMDNANETDGLFMHLDTKEWKATLTRKLVDPEDTIHSVSQGGLQHLPNDHSIMGYGSTPRIKEFNPDGDVVMSVRFGNGDNEVTSYRAYKSAWVGLPKTPPEVFSCTNGDDETKVYMSWNGATEHKEWSVFGGDSEDDIDLLKKEEKSGFETVATIPGHYGYIRAEASGAGIMPGKSAIVVPEKGC